jgi:pSer/pThr/pTyr-binding forkhead associated (FHA) protein
MVGKMINLTQPCTTIGRGADNDIVLPRDKAVSRQHAMVEFTGSEFFLSEFVSQEPSGAVKRPTYGTYVNGQKVGTLPIQLKTGDEIQLGTRFKMTFEKLQSANSAGINSDRTFEDPDDQDKTMIM